MNLSLTSPSFSNGEAIPPEFTCEGKDMSPALRWAGGPSNTKTYALIVDDPDAPDPKAPKMTWVHWVLYDIPASTKELAAAVSSGDLPAGTKQGLNDWKRTGYGGPCPPIGRHRYFFKLYALDTELKFDKTPLKTDVETAMHGHILAETVLMGTYQKRG
jgi:Raf kinase inhibitor-like YbhB/YbcL family protein